MAKKNRDKQIHHEIELPTMIFFSAIDCRRRPEMFDSSLISEDHTKHANLPEEYKYGKFSQEYY
jgi:hypothetical protein